MNSSELATYILQNGTVDAKTLMARLGLKERAMRSRIQHANDSLAGCARIAFSRSHGGYEIAVYDEEALKVRLQDGNRADRLDDLPSTPKERVEYLLHNLLARDSWIKLDDIASMLCVSRATISNDLKDVQRVLDEYGLALEKRPRYGMRVTGEEIDRRNCLAAIAVNTTLSSEHLRPVTSDILERLSASVYKVLECEGVKINPFAHHNLIVYIAVTLSRIREGRVLEAGLTPLDAYSIRRVETTDPTWTSPPTLPRSTTKPGNFRMRWSRRYGAPSDSTSEATSSSSCRSHGISCPLPCVSVTA